MRVLTAEAMREVDRRAIEEVGIPSLVLMENAALGVVDAIGEGFPRCQTVAVVCGPGNNGGDGLAIARHLAVRGYGVRLFLLDKGSDPGGDAGTQLGICQSMGLDPVRLRDAADLPRLDDCDLLVDALFGTGLSRRLEGLFARVVEAMNRFPQPVVAVDLPSGLDASSPEPLGPHVRAHLTVTFAAPKVAHLFAPAADAVGEVVVTDLGIPPKLVEEAEGDLGLLVEEELAGSIPEREAASHKGDHGHLLLVAGAPGKSGAVILAARAAVRGGAGLVTAGVPAPILPTVDLGSLESMTLALSCDDRGRLDGASVDQVLGACRGKDVLALGPGLGVEGETAEAVREMALRCPLPLVLDADGVNAFAGRAEQLADREAPTLLTPHPGELAGLLGIETAEVVADRLGAARRAARETAGIVVLKGHQSLVATGRRLFVNPTGNPGMATGGSGDVLTGFLAALVAQGIEPGHAACLAVFLHGLAGDLALEARGETSLAAADLLDALAPALARLRAGATGSEP